MVSQFRATVTNVLKLQAISCSTVHSAETAMWHKAQLVMLPYVKFTIGRLCFTNRSMSARLGRRRERLSVYTWAAELNKRSLATEVGGALR